MFLRKWGVVVVVEKAEREAVKIALRGRKWGVVVEGRYI